MFYTREKERESQDKDVVVVQQTSTAEERTRKTNTREDDHMVDDKGLEKKGRDGGVAERDSAAERMRAVCLSFREWDGVQTVPKVEAGGWRRCVCLWRVATVGGTEKAEVVRQERAPNEEFSSLLGGSVRPSGSISSAWFLRHWLLLLHQLQPARGFSL